MTDKLIECLEQSLNFTKILKSFLLGLSDGLQQNFEKGAEEMKYNNINITKINDGRYQIITQNNCLYGNTPEECFRKFIEFYQVEHIKSNIVFKQWIDEWFDTYKITNKSTSNDMIKSLIKNYVSEFFDYDIKDIKSVMLNKQINNVYIRGKQRQAQKLYVLYNDIFDKALKNNIIDSNPCMAIKKPKYKAKEKNALTLDEENILIDYIKNSKYKNVILFCLYQGLRIGEALALKFCDIDFVNKKINIYKSKNSKNVITTPKTETSNRVIPLFDKTLNIFENVQNSEDFIFNFSYDEIQKFLRDFAKKFNINITSHTLRHTFATRCIEKGVNIKQVSKWLGHTSIAITNDIYTHINNDFELKEIEILNKK